MLPPLTPVIAGPTAGGKSALAVELALALRDRRGIPAEIITADAFQVYTGLDIGTAKPTIEDRRGIPHHLIDIVAFGTSALRADNPDRANALFTVNHWLQLATAKIADLRTRNTLPIVVGGTHLYIKALLDGLFDGPEPDPALRDQLAAMDPAARRAELERIDPAAAARIHPNDARRAIRAIEVFRLTGKPISAHQTQWDSGSAPPPRSPFLLTILDWETEPLNHRINARIREMMTRGLLDEVRQLNRAGSFTSQSSEALGYKQLLPIVRGPWPPAPAALDDAVERIKIETRRFAKNQRTWLRRLRTTPSSLVLPCPMASPLEGVEAILRRISVA
ncbi:MAG: tRNA (adenosine(37)-N6)-dimethylallyltransferase MiaA [Phycisphaerales bacterium]|nr:tRNA (adenosine(37)-N6)-dimethylallyltransferase MiaA [Phycisphaerales bacterium]